MASVNSICTLRRTIFNRRKHFVASSSRGEVGVEVVNRRNNIFNININIISNIININSIINININNSSGEERSRW